MNQDAVSQDTQNQKQRLLDDHDQISSQNQGINEAKASNINTGGEAKRKGTEVERKKDAYGMQDHLLTYQELSDKYKTQLDVQDPGKSHGLTKQEAESRLLENGKNALTPPPEMPEILKFLMQFKNGFMLLMLGAGILAVIAYIAQSEENIYNLVTGLVLWGIVFLTCLMSYYQERQSNNAMAQFKKMLPPQCRVFRDGKEQIVEAQDLVLGDIVKVQGGDRVPADLITVQVSGLKVEQSAITGEAESIEIFADSQDPHFLETKNLLFNGCFCLEGSAVGVVCRTGDNTYIGTIARDVLTTKGVETTLQREIHRFVLYITIISIVCAVVFFIIGWQNGIQIFDAFIQGFIMVICANIPEGLPATVTSLLTITAKKLAAKNVFVKTLEGVETLGSTSVIASDKTGTLTQNKMSVANLWFDYNVYHYTLFTEVVQADGGPKNTNTFKELYRVACLCNKAFFQEDVQQNNEIIKKETQKKGIAIDQNSRFSQMQLNNRKSTYQQNRASVAFLDQPIEVQKQIISQMTGEKRQQYQQLLDAQQQEQQQQQKKSSFARKASKPQQIDMQSVKKYNENFKKQGQISEEVEYEDEKERVKANIRESIQFNQKVYESKKGEAKIIGDASEIALLRFCEKVQDTEDFRSRNNKIFEIPFNSKNKYQLSIHTNEELRQKFMVLKGAPERVIGMCSFYQHEGRKVPIDEEFQNKFEDAYKIFGKQGERVLGFAKLQLQFDDNTEYNEKAKNYPMSGLTFVGLISLIDPPKNGVPEAVELCRTAGVRVCMITGDHPFTAEAIARKVSIIRDFETKEEVAARLNIPLEEVKDEDYGAAVTFGPNLNDFTQEDWDRLICKPELVFARISPQQKFEITEQFQKYGDIVAVTGDGVNDSIALKKADIGVAMGIGGNEVAKASADMILMDDNFASIVIGIKLGRVLFDNLKKSIAYTLAHSIPELIPIFIYLVAALPPALNPLLLLTIDLLTEQGPAISLAFEKEEDDIMERPPRNARTDRLVSGTLLAYSYLQSGIMISITGLLCYFAVFFNAGLRFNSLHGVDNEANDYFDISTTKNYTFINANTGQNVTLNPDQQRDVLHLAYSAFYTMVVFSQFFHVWMIKTRTQSIFTHGIFQNKYNNYGVLFELAILVLVVYCPGLQTVFQTANLGGQYWAWGFISLGDLWIFNETRKWWTRKYPKGKVAKILLW